MASAEIPVLLVEPDPLVREMLQAALRIHRANLAPVATDDPQQALRLARETEFRLIVSEAEVPTPEEGQRFFHRLAEALPETPILALTEGSRAALSVLIELDLAVVTKPLDMDHLLRRVDQLLEQRSVSRVRGIGLESLLQVLKAERKTCRIAVQCHGNRGRLGLQEGRLVHAETARASGIAALFETLGWREPVLRIVNGDTVERTIEIDLDSLLLRFCVESDHQRREAEGGRD